MKICNKCKRELDESCFSVKRAAKDGLNTICKECKKEYDRLYDERKRQELKQNNIKIEKCCKCGKQIKYENLVDGQYVVSMFCKDCFSNQAFKDLVCERCGKVFKVGRKPSKLNDFISRKYCPECSTMNQDKKEIICQKCGKIYYAYRSPDGRHFRKQKYCPECSKPATEKTVYCERCGKPFIVTKYPGTDSFRKIRFCSNVCANSNSNKQIKSFVNGEIHWKTVMQKCKHCGKEFELKRDEKGNLRKREVCDECLKPKVKPETEDRICSLCGKKFKVGLMPCGNYSSTQYCSDECARIGFRAKCKKTCQEKYGVDYPCLTEKAMEHNAGNIISETNKRFAKLLDENSIRYTLEFKIDNYSYDFKIENTNYLVEINPTYTHNSYYNHFGQIKEKEYHHNKTKFALDNGYICVCIWDWDNWIDIVKLLKTPKLNLAETYIRLHYSKNKENIIVSEESDYYLEKGYLPVYDDGFKVIP